MRWCGLLADEVTGQQLLSLGALRKELLENPTVRCACPKPLSSPTDRVYIRSRMGPGLGRVPPCRDVPEDVPRGRHAGRPREPRADKEGEACRRDCHVDRQGGNWSRDPRHHPGSPSCGSCDQQGRDTS